MFDVLLGLLQLYVQKSNFPVRSLLLSFSRSSSNSGSCHRIFFFGAQVGIEYCTMLR
jgi:hypothetical protein